MKFETLSNRFSRSYVLDRYLDTQFSSRHKEPRREKRMKGRRVQIAAFRSWVNFGRATFSHFH